MLFIAQERSPKYADKFLDKVKPLLVEPKVSRRLCFFSFSQSSIWSYVNVYNGVYSVAMHSNTISLLYTQRLTSYISRDRHQVLWDSNMLRGVCGPQRVPRSKIHRGPSCRRKVSKSAAGGAFTMLEACSPPAYVYKAHL